MRLPQKRKKEKIEEMTLEAQKAISESISSLARSGDMHIVLEKKAYMDNAEINFLTCDD